jgi:nucleotide-binding universal stress UspA family protein
MRILVGTDGSDSAHKAVAMAATLAAATGGSLLILLVAESNQLTINAPLTSFEWDRQALNPQARIETPDAAESQRLLDEAVAIAAEGGMVPSTLRLVGDAAKQICDTARQHAIDLIVVGSHGRTGLTRLLMGSVAEAVVRHATCSVLVAKGLPDKQ